MSYISEKINGFVLGNIKLKSALESFSKKISSCDTEISNVLSTLQEKVKTSVVSKGADKQIRENLKKINENFSTTVKAWHEGIEKARKGMKFIEDFEKYSIVTIFGKVKCGKSFLGNYMMGNGIRNVIKTEYDKFDKAKVEIYDRGNTKSSDKFEELEEGFGVKSTEATSVIQWFFMGGMAWFDTPGIGSVTIENELLAKEYVKNSDMIVYISNSDAAGTRQDFQELAELANMGKPVLLLVSMSDTYEEDEGPKGELIRLLKAKTPKDRKDVETYLYDEIKNSCPAVLEHSEMLTISTKLAIEAIKNNDEALFKDSNIDKFYDKLNSIMGEKAVEFKTANPKKRINGLIEEIIKGNHLKKAEKDEITGIEGLINRFKEETLLIEKKVNDIKGFKEKILKKLRSECNPRISLIIKKMASSMGEGGEPIPAEEIIKSLSEVVYDNLCKIMEKEIGSQIDDFRAKSVSIVTDNSFGIGSIQNKTDKISYTVTHVSRRERGPDGMWESICGFFGRKYYSNRTTTSTKDVEFNIGTNEQEVFMEIMNKFNDYYGPQIDREISSITNDYYGSISKTVYSIISDLEETSKKLRKIKL